MEKERKDCSCSSAFHGWAPAKSIEHDSLFLRFSVYIVRKGGEILYSFRSASSLQERIFTFTSGRWVRTSMTVSLVSLVELI